MQSVTATTVAERRFAVDGRELADMAARLDHRKRDLATARGVVHHPDPALADEQHVAGFAVAIQDLLARTVAAPAAAPLERGQLGCRQRRQQPDLTQTSPIVRHRSAAPPLADAFGTVQSYGLKRRRQA